MDRMTPSCPKCEKAYPSPSPKDCDWCGGRLQPMTEPDVSRFLAQFQEARDGMKKWPQWMQDAAHEAAATFPLPPSLLPVESESGERKQEQENGNG